MFNPILIPSTLKPQKVLIAAGFCFGAISGFFLRPSREVGGHPLGVTK
jgi:hypothetical protein